MMVHQLTVRVLLGWLTAVAACLSNATARAAEKPPNFVVVFTDDQGYQDVGVFGSPDIETPNLDRMAGEGVRMTDFYVSQAVCSASRSAAPWSTRRRCRCTCW